jgi:hypothetical protein
MTKTLQQLSDYHEVMQLRLGFAALHDANDWPALAELFAVEAIANYPAMLGGQWVGRQAIIDNIMRLNTGGSPYDALHIMTNPRIVLDSAEAAHGSWYLTDFLTRQRGEFRSLGGHANPLIFLGMYHDQYCKIDGVWQFWRVRLELLWPDRVPAVSP